MELLKRPVCLDPVQTCVGCLISGWHFGSEGVGCALVEGLGSLLSLACRMHACMARKSVEADVGKESIRGAVCLQRQSTAHLQALRVEGGRSIARYNGILSS